MMKSLVAFGVLVVGLLVGLATVGLRSGPQELGSEIPSTDGWVAFSADIQRQMPGRVDGVAGRFYRNTDGSTREETWPEANPSKTVIEILNVPTATYYGKPPNGLWEQHPMVLPAGGYLPPKMRAGTKGLSPAVTSINGVEAYRLVGSHMIEFRAPRLNFFPILIENPETGTRQQYLNIVEGEPDPTLFMPPADVAIEHRQQPMGIVAGPVEKGQMPAAKAGPCCGQQSSATERKQRSY